MDFDTLFPDVRESGETRLRQCQLVMLRMLKIFDYLCQKHNINYFLVGGSLLGAVRHHGFIPWDDDLDVGMTRPEFEKFVQLAVPELPNDIFFQTPETDVHFPACGRVEAKLKDKYSSYILGENEQHKKQHLGLQLDLFIYDKAYLPNTTLIFAMNRSLEAMFWKIGENNYGNIRRARVLKWVEKYVPLPFVYSSSFILRYNMIKLGTYLRADEIKELERIKFEDMEVSIPKGWHTHLKRQYGDYMKLPPVEKRQVSHSAHLPDPFTPSNHTEILYWKNRKAAMIK